MLRRGENIFPWAMGTLSNLHNATGKRTSKRISVEKRRYEKTCEVLALFIEHYDRNVAAPFSCPNVWLRLAALKFFQLPELDGVASSRLLADSFLLGW